MPNADRNTEKTHSILDPGFFIDHHASIDYFPRRHGNVKDVLTLILAGGKGTRLEPLTRDRAKPAVPFGRLYRIIDFTLSNCINRGLRRIRVLTQFKSVSPHRHIRPGWDFLSPELNGSAVVVPPQPRID